MIRPLDGSVGIPVRGAADAPLRRTGIVGAGMAGVSLAWLLDGQREVLLLEAAPEIGGDVQSLVVNLDDQSFVVDFGAQFFNRGVYPTYVKLLDTLGLRSREHSFATSITLFDPSEPRRRFASPALPQRAWPLFAPWNRAGLEAFAKAFASARKREEENASWDVTMAAWLRTLNLSEEQSAGMIVPWAASLYSGSIEEAMGYSARAAMIFAAKALPTNAALPVTYSVLNSGMAEVLRRMIAQTTTVQVRTNAAVAGVERNQQGGFTLHCAGGQAFPVDDLVFAASGPPTLSLLAPVPGTGAQQAALRGIEFRGARLALHTDPIYAPVNPLPRSFLNVEIEGNYCEASMWLADVLDVPPRKTAAKLWKSWVTYRTRQPAQVLHEARFQHMVPTPASIHAQNALDRLQGEGGIWFAGGYTHPYDSQETALLSSLEIAQKMSASSRRHGLLAV